MKFLSICVGVSVIRPCHSFIEGRFELEEAVETISKLRAQLLEKDDHIATCEAKLQTSEGASMPQKHVRLLLIMSCVSSCLQLLGHSWQN